MEENTKELKKLFEATKKARKEATDLSYLLDKKINEIFGFNYSETENDEIIDTLDYATNNISFKHFFELMKYYKDERGFGSSNQAE